MASRKTALRLLMCALRIEEPGQPEPVIEQRGFCLDHAASHHLRAGHIFRLNQDHIQIVQEIHVFRMSIQRPLQRGLRIAISAAAGRRAWPARSRTSGSVGNCDRRASALVIASGSFPQQPTPQS